MTADDVLAAVRTPRCKLVDHRHANLEVGWDRGTGMPRIDGLYGSRLIFPVHLHAKLGDFIRTLANSYYADVKISLVIKEALCQRQY